MQERLCLETLGNLDCGAAGLIIDAAIRDALADLDDRGSDLKPRKVEIAVTLKVLDNGQVEAHVEACARLPRRRTASTIANLKRQGEQQPRLMFQTMAPDNPDQRTIDEL